MTLTEKNGAFAVASNVAADVGIFVIF